jgi:hypothetical protein
MGGLIMPCRDGGEDCNYREEYCSSQKQVEKLEVLLCSACTALEDKKYKFAANPALDKWWDKHKKADELIEAQNIRERLRRQEAKLIAETVPIIKMTKEQKAMLKAEGYL